MKGEAASNHRDDHLDRLFLLSRLLSVLFPLFLSSTLILVIKDLKGQVGEFGLESPLSNSFGVCDGCQGFTGR